MRFLVCFLLSLNLVACATTERYVALPEDGGPPTTNHVAKGNLVQVATKDGLELEFRVLEINDEGISGDRGLIRWQDIQTLQVVEPGDSSAMWVVLGVIGVVGALFLLSEALESAAAAAVFDCSGC